MQYWKCELCLGPQVFSHQFNWSWQQQSSTELHRATAQYTVNSLEIDSEHLTTCCDSNSWIKSGRIIINSFMWVKRAAHTVSYGVEAAVYPHVCCDVYKGRCWLSLFHFKHGSECWWKMWLQTLHTVTNTQQMTRNVLQLCLMTFLVFDGKTLKSWDNFKLCSTGLSNSTFQHHIWLSHSSGRREPLTDSYWNAVSTLRS